jgi:hypothetical protein
VPLSWWSGAGSNRRPSAFQRTALPRADQAECAGPSGRRRALGVINPAERISAGFQIRIARTYIDPSDLDAEFRRRGFTGMPRELRRQAGHLREMAKKTNNPERRAELEAKRSVEQ